MTWPKVAALAGAIILGFLLHGGIYTFGTFNRLNPTRMNRLTGRIEVWVAGQGMPAHWKVLEDGGTR